MNATQADYRGILRSETLDRHFYGFSPPYWGPLFDDDHEEFRIKVFGFDNTNDHNSLAESSHRVVKVPRRGSCFGYVLRGRVSSLNQAAGVGQGQFFVTRSGAEILLTPGSRLMLIQQEGYRAIPLTGGPIEEAGRLRYIDGCSDTMLVGPLLKGGPCLNHLHVPPGIDQTFHTHPSIRVGCVAYGEGAVRTPLCEWPVEEDGSFDLKLGEPGAVALAKSVLSPGMIWVIPRHGIHGFMTEESALGVIPYHPDTDQGPDHEHHPMKSRTLVGGQEVDNTGPRNEAAIVDGYFDPDAPSELNQ